MLQIVEGLTNDMGRVAYEPVGPVEDPSGGSIRVWPERLSLDMVYMI